jgi:hypothetical protein
MGGTGTPKSRETAIPETESKAFTDLKGISSLSSAYQKTPTRISGYLQDLHGAKSRSGYQEKPNNWWPRYPLKNYVFEPGILIYGLSGRYGFLWSFGPVALV